MGVWFLDDLERSDPRKLEVMVYNGADSTFTLFEDGGTSADPSTNDHHRILLE
jgi:hypothetical protein